MTQSHITQRSCKFCISTLSALVMGMAISSFPQVGFALDPEATYKAANKSYQYNDWVTAIAQLRESAKVQHVPSMVMLAYILDRAEEDSEAIDWYRKAAMMNSAEAAMQLGIMLADGSGVEKNPSEGLEWVTRSAKLGHHPAMMLLVDVYTNSHMGAKPDPVKAKKWLELAAMEIKIRPDANPVGKRYMDNGDGTITDYETGLVGLKNANCFGRKKWKDAMAAARRLSNGDCGLSDGSQSGDWRLPTKDELKTLIAWEKGGAFSGVQASYYWSSTSYAGYTDDAWNVNLNGGHVDSNSKAVSYYVWPVRGGQ